MVGIDMGRRGLYFSKLFRVTGNLAGRSAKFVLKKSGDYIGDSLVAVTGAIGGGVQEATESVGLGQVGAGVNSVVTGLGVGVSKSVKGVGSGAGDILRGTGKGIVIKGPKLHIDLQYSPEGEWLSLESELKIGGTLRYQRTF